MDRRTFIGRVAGGLLAGLALACLVGSLSSCGTMGGGGMKYLADPPFAAKDRLAT